MPRLKFLSRFVSALVIISIAATTSAQQAQIPNLSKKAAAIKRMADSLTPGARISVIPLHGREMFGEFLSNDEVGLTFHDVDDKINVTLEYSEVRKLKKGYGGYNSPTGRHTDRTRGIIVTVVVIAGLLGVLIGVLAASKD